MHQSPAISIHTTTQQHTSQKNLEPEARTKPDARSCNISRPSSSYKHNAIAAHQFRQEQKFG